MLVSCSSIYDLFTKFTRIFTTQVHEALVNESNFIAATFKGSAKQRMLSVDLIDQQTDEVH